MRDIIYAAPWSKNKINTWSGTIYHLRKSLKKYCTIQDIDTEVFSSKNPSVLMYRTAVKLQKIIHAYKQDMNMSRMALMDKHIKIARSDAPILQFEECPGIEENTKQFIYQDLSVSVIENLYNCNRDLFNTSGFQFNDISAIHKRNVMQKIFYNNAAGIFTMSHWLVNELEEYKDKVFLPVVV